MNSDSEAINQFMAWLLQSPDSLVSTPSGDVFSQGDAFDFSDADPSQLHHLDPLDSEEIDLESDFSGSIRFSFEAIPLVEPGDRPAVQDRFYTLLKSRLRAEIEQKPPLFPWETEFCDYESEVTDWNAPKLVPAGLWSTHLLNLSLPVPMPEAVLNQLFNHCQAVVQSSLREGAKLVRAVEELFPGQSQTLNHLAGLVVATPARSGSSASLAALPGLPNRYDAATQPQQMALSLIAAREILESLTLRVSPEQPKIERQWNTAVGTLTLQAETLSGQGPLRIQGQLPSSGSLHLKGDDVQAIAQRANPGYISVELYDFQPDRAYPLEVRLSDSDQTPLILAIYPMTVDNA